jgi:hypothetical protein
VTDYNVARAKAIETVRREGIATGQEAAITIDDQGNIIQHVVGRRDEVTPLDADVLVSMREGAKQGRTYENFHYHPSGSDMSLGDIHAADSIDAYMGFYQRYGVVTDKNIYTYRAGEKGWQLDTIDQIILNQVGEENFGPHAGPIETGWRRVFKATKNITEREKTPGRLLNVEDVLSSVNEKTGEPITDLFPREESTGFKASPMDAVDIAKGILNEKKIEKLDESSGWTFKYPDEAGPEVSGRNLGETFQRPGSENMVDTALKGPKEEASVKPLVEVIEHTKLPEMVEGKEWVNPATIRDLTSKEDVAIPKYNEDMFMPRTGGQDVILTEIIPGVKLVTKTKVKTAETIKTPENYLSGYPIEELITRKNVEKIFGKPTGKTGTGVTDFEVASTLVSGSVANIFDTRIDTGLKNDKNLSIFQNKKQNLNNKQLPGLDTSNKDDEKIINATLTGVLTAQDSLTSQITGQITNEKQDQGRRQGQDQVQDTLQNIKVRVSNIYEPEERRRKPPIPFGEVLSNDKLNRALNGSVKTKVRKNPIASAEDMMSVLGFGGR